MALRASLMALRGSLMALRGSTKMTMQLLKAESPLTLAEIRAVDLPGPVI
jgi:hypothetical protein